jgi:hypothetical protein
LPLFPFSVIFRLFFSPFSRHQFLPQYCHCHYHFTTIRTASLPSFQRYHPTTATPPTSPATATRLPLLPFSVIFRLFFLPNLRPSYLGQYCHCHLLSGTIRTAPIPSFQRYHPTSATTATLTATATHFHDCHFLSFFFFFFTHLSTIISRPILPLPLPF